MLLSARLLDQVSSVNDFNYIDTVSLYQGDTVRVYFQLIDAARDRATQLYQPAGRRFVPAAGATLVVVLENIDDAVKVTRTATQPFAADGSMWYIDLLSTDVISGTVNMALTLTESGKVTSGRLEAAISIPSTGCL